MSRKRSIAVRSLSWELRALMCATVECSYEMIGRDNEQSLIDRFITIQISICLHRCTCSIPTVCLRSRKVGLNPLDLSQSAVNPVYDLG
jgi:hypothetical protein